VLFLLFHVGDDTYALGAGHVREVIPRVLLRECPGAPAYVAGLFNYRGIVVPVLDFCQMVQRPPCRPRLSTRLLLLECGAPAENSRRLLALMVESLIQTLEVEESAFSQPGLAAGATPFLGPIFCDQKRLIQRLLPDRLLSAEAAGIFLGSQPPEKRPCLSPP
jgi:chemotaxis-related protein WspB